MEMSSVTRKCAVLANAAATIGSAAGTGFSAVKFAQFVTAAPSPCMFHLYSALAIYPALGVILGFVATVVFARTTYEVYQKMNELPPLHVRAWKKVGKAFNALKN